MDISKKSIIAILIVLSISLLLSLQLDQFSILFLAFICVAGTVRGIKGVGDGEDGTRIVAAYCSFMPGLGHIYLKKYKFGIILMILTAFFMLGGFYLLSLTRDELLGLLIPLLGFTTMLMISIVETDLAATELGLPFPRNRWIRNEDTIEKGYHGMYLSSIVIPYILIILALLYRLPNWKSEIEIYYWLALPICTLMFLIGLWRYVQIKNIKFSIFTEQGYD